MNPVRARVVEEVPPASFTDHTAHTIVCALECLGFTDGDAFRDISDKPPQGVYLTRQLLGQHQHCFIASYDGQFCEAIIYVYAKSFDPRAKVRQVPLYTGIARTLAEVTAAVERVYTPAVKPT